MYAFKLLENRFLKRSTPPQPTRILLILRALISTAHAAQTTLLYNPSISYYRTGTHIIIGWNAVVSGEDDLLADGRRRCCVGDYLSRDA